MILAWLLVERKRGKDRVILEAGAYAKDATAKAAAARMTSRHRIVTAIPVTEYLGTEIKT